jgi:hypothetical protein
LIAMTKPTRSPRSAQRAALPAERAFVVQLRGDANLGRGPIRGRVEHVHSGAAALFESLEQLLACMQDALDARGRRRIPPHSPNRSKADPARLTTPRRDHEA